MSTLERDLKEVFSKIREKSLFIGSGVEAAKNVLDPHIEHVLEEIAEDLQNGDITAGDAVEVLKESFCVSCN